MPAGGIFTFLAYGSGNIRCAAKVYCLHCSIRCVTQYRTKIGTCCSSSSRRRRRKAFGVGTAVERVWRLLVDEVGNLFVDCDSCGYAAVRYLQCRFICSLAMLPTCNTPGLRGSERTLQSTVPNFKTGHQDDDEQSTNDPTNDGAGGG